MSDPNERMGPGTYLTPEEAKEFHKLFMTSFVIFTAVAIGRTLPGVECGVPGSEGLALTRSRRPE